MNLKSIETWLTCKRKINIARNVKFLKNNGTFENKIPSKFLIDEAWNEVRFEFPVGSAGNNADNAASKQRTYNREEPNELDDGIGEDSSCEDMMIDWNDRS